MLLLKRRAGDNGFAVLQNTFARAGDIFYQAHATANAQRRDGELLCAHIIVQSRKLQRNQRSEKGCSFCVQRTGFIRVYC